jgi:glycosyltransferase involved in cell wall biosynthesis
VRAERARFRRPYFVFPHGMLDPWFKEEYPLKHLKKSVYWLGMEHRILRDAAAVLFTAEEERRRARESFPFYHCTERVVGLGTAAPPVVAERAGRNAFLESVPRLRSRPFLLFLGRIHPKKGCDLLLRAFSAAIRGGADVDLAMAGPDEVGWRGELESLAAQLGIAERVVWTGPVMGDIKWDALRAADAFVLPSHQENFGMAVAEALAVGCPVIVSNKVNIWREIVTDGAGIACDDTENGATSALSQWFSEIKDRRAEMSARAVQCFQSRFSRQAAARNLVEGLRQ